MRNTTSQVAGWRCFWRAGCALLVIAGGAPGGERTIPDEDGVVVKSFPATYLARNLASRERAVRLLAIERIEREYADHPEAVSFITETIARLEKQESGQDVTLRLIRSLRHFAGPRLTDVAVSLLKGKDYRVPMAALELLVRRNESRSLRHILALADREEFNSHYGFRTSVLQAAISFREIESVGFLVHRLPQLDGQSEAIVREYLSRLSRLPETSDPDAWNRWLDAANKSELRFDELYLHEAGAPKRNSYDRPRFFGLDVRAKHVVFVFDRSGSMTEPLRAEQADAAAKPDANETRLERAQHELATVLLQLPADVHFGIVVFNDRVNAWRPQLQPATDGNKAQAIEFVASIRAGGETAWYDAIEAALDLDANTEAIFFLTDGIPTTGRFVAAPDIVDAVADINFFHRATIHTIGLGVSSRTKRFLRILATENGGEVRTLGNHVDAVAMPVGGDVSIFTPRVAFTPPMPPINRVRAFPAAAAARRMKSNELVLGVVHQEQARAYPLNMLTGPNREIINDTFAGEPIAVTWCHLSHYGMAYLRREGQRELTFAVSGLLWNDNLVMYDTATRSTWSQIHGKAMSGPLTNTTLTRVPSTVTTWAAWRELHPETTIVLLSRTAHIYDHEIYRRSSDYVVGTSDGAVARAWPLDVLLLERAVNDRLGDRPVLATIDVVSKTPFLYDRRVGADVYSFYLKDGRIVDRQTNSGWDMVTGRAVVGNLKGRQLSPIDCTPMLRHIWLTFYPHGSVFDAEP